MKRNIVLVIILFFVLSFCLYLNNKEKPKVVVINNIKYLISIDGNSATSFPDSGIYRVDVSCMNANGKWDYDSNTLKIFDVIGNASCSLDFNTVTSPVTLTNHILSLSAAGTLQGEVEGDGYVIHEIATFNSTDYDTGYRYEGRNPYNYIWFNNELWRIIGVFDDTDHDVTGTNLTKIIRVNVLGSYVWDKNNMNNWSSSSLRTLFNTYYYNKINDNGGTSINTYCYSVANNIPITCDFATYGISSNYRSMIQLVTWQLGGHTAIEMTADASYTYERGSTKYSSNSINVDDYIGLMYPSDYGYASLEYTTPSTLTTKCSRTQLLSNYSNSNCAGSNWLYSQGFERMLMHYSSNANRIFALNNTGSIQFSNGAKYGFLSRPVLYLKSNVYIIDGNGSINDPYIIGM